MHSGDLLPALKALAHETRLRMVEQLLAHNLCVGALAWRLGISEAAASQHLQILRKAGLVKGEKQGYWTHYAVQSEELRRVADRLGSLPDQAGRLRDLNLELCSGDSANPRKGGE